MNKKERYREKVLRDYRRMKKCACVYRDYQQWEEALRMIFIASGYMYTMNQILFDDELEEVLKCVAKNVLRSPQILNKVRKKVLYYDSFGNFSRGLTKIYLDALLELKYQVVYVTMEVHENVLEEAKALLGSNNVYGVRGGMYTERMRSLMNIIEDVRAEAAFLYLNPDDVVATGVFACCEGVLDRYLINLTDHAFWLGKNACDKVICFREFGCKVARDYRKVSCDKLAYLPYYPAESESIFEGLPFEPEKEYIFSGGSLYKTKSRKREYYNLVDDILATHLEICFVYYGNGDARQMKRLVRKYRNRVCFASERSDFFETMKRCVFYLSTYPYNGGLMTQYALLAEKVPITLCHPGIDSELSIKHQQTYWNFESIDECKKEIDKMLQDYAYRKEKEQGLKNFLFKSKEFEHELESILVRGGTSRNITDENVKLTGFQEIPLETIRGLDYYRLFFRRNGFLMLKHFPVKYILGAFAMLCEKIYKI